MSTPITATKLKRLLKEWDIPFEEFRDWETHNRNHVGKWGDVKGFMVHHTGSDSSDQRALLYDGYKGLPGPLCNFGLDQRGIVHLIGHGRANHAGGGDPNVLNHVIREDYNGILTPRYHQGEPGAYDGNAVFYGLEIWYSGSKAMNLKQYQTTLKLAAALCTFHNWTAKSTIGHGEWSDWKWDPGYKASTMMRMDVMRRDIQLLIDRGPKPVAEVNEPTPMGKEVWLQDAYDAPDSSPTKDRNPKWKPINFLREIYDLARECRDLLKEIKNSSL